MKSEYKTEEPESGKHSLVTARRHTCVFYQSQGEAYEILGGLGSRSIKAGFQFVLVNEGFSLLQLHASFKKHGLGVDYYRRCSKVIPVDEIYVSEDHVSYEECRTNIENIYKRSISDGYNGVYRFTDMSWIVNGLTEHIQQMMLLENMLANELEAVKMVNFSLFNAHHFDANTLLDILCLYPAVYAHGRISDNPFFQGVSDFIKSYPERHHGETIKRNQLVSFIVK